MNKLQKTLVLAAGTAGVGFSLLGGALATHAASTTTSTTSSGSSLVDMFVQKFGLNKTDVQAVIDQDHTNHEADRAANEKTRLDKDVTSGKITQAQEDQIIAKQKEVQDFMDTLKDKSEADRKTAMDTEMAAVKTWATTNSIPEQYLHLGGPGGRGHGGPDGAPPADAPTSATVSTSTSN